MQDLNKTWHKQSAWKDAQLRKERSKDQGFAVNVAIAGERRDQETERRQHMSRREQEQEVNSYREK